MRTVEVRARKTKPWPNAQGACTFCTFVLLGGEVRHDLCPGEIKNAAGEPGSTWSCDCHIAGHNTEATMGS